VSLEIHAILTETFGEHVPSYGTVKNGVAGLNAFSTFFPWSDYGIISTHYIEQHNKNNTINNRTTHFSTRTRLYEGE
jgi:hypothetical protein